MSNEDRIKALFTASPETLARVDAALSGAPAPAPPVNLRLLGMGQVAAQTGLSRCTVWRMVRDKRLQAVEVRKGSFRIPESELVKLVEGRQ